MTKTFQDKMDSYFWNSARDRQYVNKAIQELEDEIADLFIQHKQYLLHPKVRLNIGESDKAIEQLRKDLLALIREAKHE